MEAFFDALAHNWVEDDSEYGIRQELVDAMALPPGQVILDIGCGKGVMEQHLIQTNPRRILAVDLSGEMIQAARARYDDPRMEFRCGDLLAMEMDAVDAALVFNAYPHFLDKQRLVNCLAGCVRPGGVVCVCHSRSRAVINARHREGLAFTLSAPLRPAAEEAAEFQEYFDLLGTVDDARCYSIRLRRK